MRTDNELMSAMRLCDAKNCWLKDLDHVPGWELPFWAAYYEILDRERKQAESKASAGARRR